MSKIKIDEKLLLIKLFYIYKVMLTKKQIEYFELYFEEDLSFQEIAEEKGISKSAVSDAVNNIILILKDFESKLHINQSKVKLENLIQLNQCHEITEVQQILAELEKINTWKY